MTENEMSDFYSTLLDGSYNKKLKLLTNEYLNIVDKNNKIIDTYCWTGEYFRSIKYINCKSEYLGDLKPIKGDIYQAMALDSLATNKITMLKGPAGTGKSMLSLGYLFHCLEKNKIDKIVVFCNPVATKNSAKLGFYPGSRNEKLLDS